MRHHEIPQLYQDRSASRSDTPQSRQVHGAERKAHYLRNTVVALIVGTTATSMASTYEDTGHTKQNVLNATYGVVDMYGNLFLKGFKMGLNEILPTDPELEKLKSNGSNR